MTALASFTFRGYTLRPARWDDLSLAEYWVKEDPFHKGTTKAKFWCEQKIGIESYILSDKFGPVFFFKMQRAQGGDAEIHVQFPPEMKNPTARSDQRCRVMNGLIFGFEWLERVLSLRQVNALFFDSKNPSLIRFSKRRLGFVEDGQRLKRVIRKVEVISNCGEES